jgi:hypothetical protein
MTTSPWLRRSMRPGCPRRSSSAELCPGHTGEYVLLIILFSIALELFCFTLLYIFHLMSNYLSSTYQGDKLLLCGAHGEV